MIAVVSHDAGGAELLSSYVRRGGLECNFVLEGPALRIFERKLGAVEILPLDQALLRSDSILCGTSLPASLEWVALGRARALGKRSVSFLDHWVNYRERFVRDGETRLPDEIWTGDPIAARMARDIFPEAKVTMVENPYFQDLKLELARLPARPRSGFAGLRVLFVCEPKRERGLSCFGDERHWGYVEEEALRYFLSNLAVLGDKIERIVIRPHPSEAPGKYDWASREFKLPIERGGGESLFAEVVASDVVAGCESMAMVIGLLAGKRVISAIPPGGKTCILPQPEIEPLQRLLKS